LKVTLPNPFRSGARGWGTLGQQNHAAGGENGSIMVGIFVSRVLANQKPFERELFVPARTDLGLGKKLLYVTFKSFLGHPGLHHTVGSLRVVSISLLS
jgi:hypothetical protein